MGRKRGDAGRVQISYTIFLLVSFLLTCRVVQCEGGNGVNKSPDNEVPILHHTHPKTKSKVTVPAKQPEEDQKGEQKKDDDNDKSNAVISDKNSNQIVPPIQTNQSNTKPDSEGGMKPETEENTDQTAKDEEKNAVDQENSVSDTQKTTNKSEEADNGGQKSEADETKQNGEASEKDSETSNQTESKAESKDQNDPDSKDDSGPENINKNGGDTNTNDNSVTNTTAPDSSTEQNKSKPDSGNALDADHTIQTVNTTDLTSPSLSDQSTKTDNRPKKYFPTLTPKVANPENGSNFSFFRLFILTTVVFVVLYVGYYYRHKIKRHFGNNGNEIYYHPLRTMQHNAVD